MSLKSPRSIIINSTPFYCGYVFFWISQTFVFERTTTYEVVVWFFQTLASLFWISSVFVYGGFEAGDILQLLAAIAWAMSNAAALPNTLKLRPSSARSRDVELDAV